MGRRTIGNQSHQDPEPPDDSSVILKAPGNVPLPDAVVTVTSQRPGEPSEFMVMLAVILFKLSTRKLFKVTSGPKSTFVAPVNSLPWMMTSNVSPARPDAGPTLSMVGVGGVMVMGRAAMVRLAPTYVTL